MHKQGHTGQGSVYACETTDAPQEAASEHHIVTLDVGGTIVRTSAHNLPGHRSETWLSRAIDQHIADGNDAQPIFIDVDADDFQLMLNINRYGSMPSDPDAIARVSRVMSVLGMPMSEQRRQDDAGDAEATEPVPDATAQNPESCAVTKECSERARREMARMLHVILKDGCTGSEWILNRYARLGALAYPRPANGDVVLDPSALNCLLDEMNALGRFLISAHKTGADAETIEWAARRHDHVDRLFVESQRVKKPQQALPGLLAMTKSHAIVDPIKLSVVLAAVVAVPFVWRLFSAPAYRY